MANVSIIPEVVSAEEAPAGEQWVNFLREHEEIETIVPVIFGLFVTSRLQLRGANALLVNLGVASVLRQIFRHRGISLGLWRCPSNARAPTPAFAKTGPEPPFSGAIRDLFGRPTPDCRLAD